MMARTTTGETPFSIAYGMEAVFPIEVNIPTSRVARFHKERNNKLMGLELDPLEEKIARLIAKAGRISTKNYKTSQQKSLGKRL